MVRLRGCLGGSSRLYGAGSFTVLGMDSAQHWKTRWEGWLHVGSGLELTMVPYFLGRRSVRVVLTAVTMMQPLPSSHRANLLWRVCHVTFRGPTLNVTSLLNFVGYLIIYRIIKFNNQKLIKIKTRYSPELVGGGGYECR